MGSFGLISFPCDHGTPRHVTLAGVKYTQIFFVFFALFPFGPPIDIASLTADAKRTSEFQKTGINFVSYDIESVSRMTHKKKTSERRLVIPMIETAHTRKNVNKY